MLHTRGAGLREGGVQMAQKELLQRVFEEVDLPIRFDELLHLPAEDPVLLRR